MAHEYDGNLIAVLADLHPSLVPGLDFQTRNDSDGAGDKIVSWSPTISPAPPEPTEAELTAEWQATTETRVNKENLKSYTERKGGIGIFQITDPVGAVPKPVAPNQRQALRYIFERKISWATEYASPTISPNVNSQIVAARNLEDDWYLAIGQVIGKVNDGTYTTEADVDSATEWP